MNRRIAILAALLGVQLVLGLALQFTGRSSAAIPQKLALPVADKDLDRIEIATADKQLTLQRKDGAWILPGQSDLPANADAVKLLLDRLGKLEGGTPVAVTADARQRFKVDTQSFERRIVLAHGDQALATLYIGTPARQGSHLRIDGSDAIYEVPVESYDWRPEPNGWADKQVLRVPADEIASMQIGQLIIKHGKEGDSWSAEGVPPGSSLKAYAAGTLANQVSDLDFDSVLGTTAQASWSLDHPVLDLNVARKAGGTREYRIGKIEGEEAYAVQLSDRKQIFKLATAEAKPLLDAAANDKLLEKAAPTQPKTTHH